MADARHSSNRLSFCKVVVVRTFVVAGRRDQRVAPSRSRTRMTASQTACRRLKPQYRAGSVPQRPALATPNKFQEHRAKPLSAFRRRINPAQPHAMGFGSREGVLRAPLFPPMGLRWASMALLVDPSRGCNGPRPRLDSYEPTLHVLGGGQCALHVKRADRSADPEGQPIPRSQAILRAIAYRDSAREAYEGTTPAPRPVWMKASSSWSPHRGQCGLLRLNFPP
jgi:hypothetical protein